MPDAIIEDGEITNVEQILQSIYNKDRLGKRYGRMLAALYTGLNFEDMVSYARDREAQGYTKFQCPAGDYCAKFVRQVVGAGGGYFPFTVFTGEQNVRSTASWWRKHPKKVYEYGKKEDD